MGLRFLKIAVVYLFLGGALGLGMGVSERFELAPVPAHLLLLGWASLALAGLVYHFYLVAPTTRLARASTSGCTTSGCPVSWSASRSC